MDWEDFEHMEEEILDYDPEDSEEE